MSNSSSKRGRKRNDNLPPNRARDVQRAFRARRAAHLQALEQRVAELEEENDCLRIALRLPPSTRPPLGKGPTGKDKAKNFDSSRVNHIHSTQSLGFLSSRGSSDGNSPDSRGSSGSPSGMGVSISSTQPMTVIDGDWNDTLLLNEHQHPTQHTNDIQQSHSQMTYHLTPMTAPVSAPLPVKPLHYPYNGTFASSSRSLASSHNLYSGSPAPYSHSPDRHMASSYNGHNFIRGEIRDESRTQYQYQLSFAPNDSNVHSQTPSPGLHAHSHNIQSRDSPLSYLPPHRRAVTDPQGFSIGQGFPHLPNPTQPQHASRPPEYMRQIDNHSMHLGRSVPYGSDGRFNHLP
ncbi:hypothetical protein BDN70DRAFT_849824 [Pholiota conissans]|uniref:BZIP domain-containing protein n=1 Tax=Pholiota conissans TaxID=109636 RepID=A0A9P5ZBC4_9AGAR|nr:hypothetical protein BDN70DRAFT_849824 [Pholiota conissans]